MGNKDIKAVYGFDLIEHRCFLVCRREEVRAIKIAGRRKFRRVSKAALRRELSSL